MSGSSAIGSPIWPGGASVSASSCASSGRRIRRPTRTRDHWRAGTITPWLKYPSTGGRDFGRQLLPFLLAGLELCQLHHWLCKAKTRQTGNACQRNGERADADPNSGTYVAKQGNGKQ